MNAPLRKKKSPERMNARLLLLLLLLLFARKKTLPRTLEKKTSSTPAMFFASLFERDPLVDPSRSACGLLEQIQRRDFFFVLIVRTK